MVVSVSQVMKVWEANEWLAVVKLYMDALKANGLEAPGFDYTEELLEVDELEPQRSTVRVTITLSYQPKKAG